jgi:ribosome silencing factor RsfS/YbeB/iojap
LRGISSFTDFFVICSGTSEPHLKAIAGEIETRLKHDDKVTPSAVDGYPMSQWIVIDYSDVVVHIFHEQKRASLERCAEAGVGGVKELLRSISIFPSSRGQPFEDQYGPRG